MRHADHALFDAAYAALLDQVIEQRDEAVAAFEREALLADVLRVQVALEAFGGRQLPQDAALLLGAEPMQHASILVAILQPQALFGIRHVRELGADRVAVDVLQLRQDVAQLHERGMAAVRLPVKNSESRSDLESPK